MLNPLYDWNEIKMVKNKNEAKLYKSLFVLSLIFMFYDTHETRMKKPC